MNKIVKASKSQKWKEKKICQKQGLIEMGSLRKLIMKRPLPCIGYVWFLSKNTLY